jgi:hypothetical protein
LQAIENTNDNNEDGRKRQTTPVAYVFDSLDSPYTKERYSERLKAFFDFIGLEGNSLEEKGKAFLAKAKQEINDNNNPYWIDDNIQDFLIHHKQRVKKGEIVANTISMYYWPVKLFCDGHKRNLPGADGIDWDRLAKILPKTTIIPTIERLQYKRFVRSSRIQTEG